MSVYKNGLKNFQMSKQYWDCLDKMSEVNFNPAETLILQLKHTIENYTLCMLFELKFSGENV